MADPFVGEIKLVPYNFAPLGWAYCDGQLMSIAQNEVLFMLLGTTYGGDGQNTFALPDLRGRVAIHAGSSFVQGQAAGVEAVTINTPQMPSHNHLAKCQASGVATSLNPQGRYPGVAPAGLSNPYAPAGGGAMPPTTLSQAGGSQPHNNMQPFLTLHYVIALEGVFPIHN